MVGSLLDGLKVVELTTWYAGPACGVMLAEFGASVIRVEPIIGDPVRALNQTPPVEGPPPLRPAWETTNRGKRAIALDLATAGGREIVHRLVEQADVLLTNLRPAVLTRARMDYDTLRALNERLIYAHITGHGAHGPDADRPSFDGIAFWASSGIMGILGEPDGPPVPIVGAIGDLTTAGITLGGIALALYARERTGKGQKIDTSLLNSAIWVNAVPIHNLLMTGATPQRVSRKRDPLPLRNYYQAKCGNWVKFSMYQQDRYWPLLCTAIEQPDLINAPRFATSQVRSANAEELIRILDRIFLTKTLNEWRPVFEAHQLIWGPVATIPDVVNDPNVAANNYIVEYEHHTHGTIRSLAPPIQFSETPALPPTSAPEFGEHTEQIMLELGYTWDDIAQKKSEGAIL